MVPEDLRRPDLNPVHCSPSIAHDLGGSDPKRFQCMGFFHSLRNLTKASLVTQVSSCWKVRYVWYIFPNSQFAWHTMDPGSKLCIVSSLSIHSLLRSDFSSVICISKAIRRKSASRLKQSYLTIWWADQRIIKWSQFEGTLKITEFQTPCQMKVNFWLKEISFFSHFEH